MRGGGARSTSLAFSLGADGRHGTLSGGGASCAVLGTFDWAAMEVEFTLQQTAGKGHASSKEEEEEEEGVEHTAKIVLGGDRPRLVGSVSLADGSTGGAFELTMRQGVLVAAAAGR